MKGFVPVFIFLLLTQNKVFVNASPVDFASAVDPQNWLRIPTQNAGSLSLSPKWILVSKDAPVEQESSAGQTLHVQQALYAESNRALDPKRAILQIFVVWNANEEGTLPFSDDLLGGTSGDLIAALIDARYGNVEIVDQGFLRTDLEDLSVTTYGVESLPAEETLESRESRGQKEPQQDFRYKCTSLFCGEKLVLALVKYFPEDEEHWRGEFETLLNAWVSSLTLTPRPLATAPMIAVSLPEPPASVIQGQSVTPAVYAGLALSGFIVLFVCAGKFLDWRQRRKEKRILEECKRDFLFEEDATTFSLFSLFSLEEDDVETATTPIIEMPSTDEEYVTQHVLPSLPEAIEVLENLEASWGQSFILDALKEEVVKVMEITEGTPVWQAQGVAPDYFIFQLCCRILLDMLQTGRYHIGKGILNNEGQELVRLFDCINTLRTQKAYSACEEAQKDAAFLQFCVRELK